MPAQIPDGVANLPLRSRRQAAIAANVANADTPGYRAVDVSFAALLERAGASLPLTATDARHLQAAPPAGSDWLVLTGPKPAIVDPGGDLEVRWRFGRYLAPVDVRAYDFKTGKEFFAENNMSGPAAVIPASRLPGSTIIRVYIIQSWLYKRFLGGPDYARGSEVNVIPWSQVFVRTR